jgi:hypothetical protein
MAEGSEYVSDYLEMAEAVAVTPQDRALVAESWATYDLLQGNHLAAAERCLLTLDHVCQTEGLWKNLFIALCRLGDVETIDATLRSLAELDDEYTARLVGSLSSQPDLRDVHERPAFRELVEKRVICKRAAV